MNEEAARLMLDELKNGLSNIQDFYGNEWFEYFYMSNTLGMVIGGIILLLGIGTMLLDNWIDTDFVLLAIGSFPAFMGTVIFCIHIYQQFVLIASPKVYITQEIIEILTPS